MQKPVTCDAQTVIFEVNVNILYWSCWVVQEIPKIIVKMSGQALCILLLVLKEQNPANLDISKPHRWNSPLIYWHLRKNKFQSQSVYDQLTNEVDYTTRTFESFDFAFSLTEIEVPPVLIQLRFLCLFKQPVSGNPACMCPVPQHLPLVAATIFG